LTTERHGLRQLAATAAWTATHPTELGQRRSLTDGARLTIKTDDIQTDFVAFAHTANCRLVETRHGPFFTTTVTGKQQWLVLKSDPSRISRTITSTTKKQESKISR